MVQPQGGLLTQMPAEHWVTKVLALHSWLLTPATLHVALPKARQGLPLTPVTNTEVSYRAPYPDTEWTQPLIGCWVRNLPGWGSRPSWLMHLTPTPPSMVDGPPCAVIPVTHTEVFSSADTPSHRAASSCGVLSPESRGTTRSSLSLTQRSPPWTAHTLPCCLLHFLAQPIERKAATGLSSLAPSHPEVAYAAVARGDACDPPAAVVPFSLP